jgi:hypothetical protein
MDYNTVIKRIETYMSKFEGDYGIWISFGADTDEIAKKVESYLLDRKTDGNPTELEEGVRIVYVYKKNSQTNP